MGGKESRKGRRMDRFIGFFQSTAACRLLERADDELRPVSRKEK